MVVRIRGCEDTGGCKSKSHSTVPMISLDLKLLEDSIWEIAMSQDAASSSAVVRVVRQKLRG